MSEQTNAVLPEKMAKFVAEVYQFAKQLSEYLSPGENEYKSFGYKFHVGGETPEDGFDGCELEDSWKKFHITIVSTPTGTVCHYMGKEPDSKYDQPYGDQLISDVENIAQRVGERRRWRREKWSK